jgi:hypothetical protein
MSIIEIKSLTKTFGKIQAVRGSETQTLEANNLKLIKVHAKVCKTNYPASAGQDGIN